MSKKKVSFGVIAGGLSLAVDSLSGLIIFPLLLKYCTKEIAGLWLFYTSFSVIINLGQAGLAPVVMRKAAEAKNSEDSQAILSFKGLIDRGYQIVTLVVTTICALLYFLYIYFVVKEDSNLFIQGTIAWVLFSLGNIVQMYFIKNLHIINGFGEVGWDKLLNIIISILRLSGYFVVLKIGQDLVGLSIVYFGATVVFAIGSLILLKKFLPMLRRGHQSRPRRKEVVSLFKVGGQVLILNVVGILVMKKDVYIIERFLGLDTIPLYSSLGRVQSMIYAVSMLVPQMLFPFIAESYTKKDFNRSYRLYWRGIKLSIFGAIGVSLILLLLANKLIPLWLGDGNYLGDSIFGLILLFGLINIHHNAHSTAVISTGANYFMWPAVANAILVIPFSILGMQLGGIPGMLIGNILATIIPSIYVVNFSINFFSKLRLRLESIRNE